MSLSIRQFNHLTEMGISLWRSNTPTAENSSVENDSLDIDLVSISQLSLFTDILQCLNLSVGEVNCDGKQLDLGLFNWQFNEGEQITYDDNMLTTPIIETFHLKPQLKRQLWQTFIKHNLLSS